MFMYTFNGASCMTGSNYMERWRACVRGPKTANHFLRCIVYMCDVRARVQLCGNCALAKRKATMPLARQTATDFPSPHDNAFLGADGLLALHLLLSHRTVQLSLESTRVVVDIFELCSRQFVLCVDLAYTLEHTKIRNRRTCGILFRSVHLESKA